jgi:phosphopantothenoylcysteine synthetase/decarboxylase
MIRHVYNDIDVVIAAAAVADYRPKNMNRYCRIEVALKT